MRRNTSGNNQAASGQQKEASGPAWGQAKTTPFWRGHRQSLAEVGTAGQQTGIVASCAAETSPKL